LPSSTDRCEYQGERAIRRKDGYGDEQCDFCRAVRHNSRVSHSVRMEEDSDGGLILTILYYCDNDVRCIAFASAWAEGKLDLEEEE